MVLGFCWNRPAADTACQTFTALELADRSHQAENRKRVFDDLSTKPTAWTSLYQGCIAQLGKSYQRLSTRGGRLAPATTTASASAAHTSKQPLTSIPTAQPRQVQSVFYVPPEATKPAALVDGVKATDARLVELASAGISYIRQRAAPKTKDALGHAGERALEWISPLEKRVPEDMKRPVVKTLTEAGETARQGVESLHKSLEVTKERVQAVAAQVAKPADEEWRRKGLWPVVDRWTNRIAPPGSWRRGWAEWFMRRVEGAFARRWAADEIEFVLPRRRIDADLFRSTSDRA